VDVELLVIPDCPHTSAAAGLLRRALADLGRADTPVRVRVIASEREAVRVGFAGSPTVLIDGTDPFAPPARPAGLTCRLYGTSGLPDLDQLRQALKRRIESPSG
jgi:hypothetical protein